MKKISVIKLGNMNHESLEKYEMDFLTGGYYCSGGIDNFKANNYSGLCSCFCGGAYGDYSSGLSGDAAYTQSSGTIVP